jgi:hypothetical protein
MLSQFWWGSVVEAVGQFGLVGRVCRQTLYVQSWVIKQAVGDHVVCDTVLVTDSGCEPLTTVPGSAAG